MSAISRLQRALAREAKRAERDLAAALESLARSHVARLTGPRREGDEVERVSACLARLSAAADLGGRLELRFGKKAAAPEEFAAKFDVIPSVAFGEAIRDLEERDPIGAAELQRLGLEVEDVYGSTPGPDGRPFYRHSFAAARAVDAEVAARVKERLVNGLVRGESTQDVAASISEDWDWPKSYSALVARNAYNSATTSGRFREAERVQRAGIPVGFEFQAVMDSNTRPGHAALNGLRMRSDDPILRAWSPPLAPNCRCVLSPLIGDDVPAGFATLPSGAEKDPGYGINPAIQTYR